LRDTGDDFSAASYIKHAVGRTDGSPNLPGATVADYTGSTALVEQFFGLREQWDATYARLAQALTMADGRPGHRIGRTASDDGHLGTGDFNLNPHFLYSADVSWPDGDVCHGNADIHGEFRAGAVVFGESFRAIEVGATLASPSTGAMTFDPYVIVGDRDF